MTSWITICDTCKRDDWEARGADTTDGEVLAVLIEGAAKDSDVQVRRFSCLMGCARACNVTVQAAGKVNYSLGNFDPNPESAEGLVAYAELHGQSETGVVPYREWPQAIKGHFVSRHPPLSGDD